MQFLAVSAFARVPLLDPMMGGVVDAILGVAAVSGLTPEMHPVDSSKPENAHLVAKVAQSIRELRQYSGHRFRYDSFRVVVVQGDPEQPNAFCTGPSIYVTRHLIQKLSARQLTAVLAHEIAHAEQGHLTQRMTHGFAGALLQIGGTLASEAHYVWSGGESDAFMRDLMEKGHWQMLQDLLGEAELGQEMQADCLATGWLVGMQGAGRNNQPQDIADALLTAVGISEREANDYIGLGERINSLRVGQYLGSRCM